MPDLRHVTQRSRDPHPALAEGRPLAGGPGDSRVRFKLLDALRGVAAVAVLLYHFGARADLAYLFPRGYLAVDFFFVLSGYVLGHAYGHSLRTCLSAGMFAARRLVRLLPMLIPGMLLGAIFELGRPGAGPLAARLPEIGLAVVAGCLALPLPFAFSMEKTIFPLDGPVWSVFFELVANLALIVAWKSLKPRTVMWAVLLPSCLLMILISRAFGTVNLGFWYTDWFDGLPRALFSFSAGVLLVNSRVRFQRLPAYVFPVALMTIFLIPVGSAGLGVGLDVAIIVLVFPALVGSAVASEPASLPALAWRLPGELSYPVYAIHYPIVRAVASALKHHALSIGWRLGAAALTLAFICVLSLGLWQVYDKPVRRWLGMRLNEGSSRQTLRA